MEILNEKKDNLGIISENSRKAKKRTVDAAELVIPIPSKVKKTVMYFL